MRVKRIPNTRFYGRLTVDRYEGRHRWDPRARWTEEAESSVVWKTDTRLLGWICLMYFGLQLDRGNLGNALTDNFLEDQHFTTDGNQLSVSCQIAPC